MERFVRAGDLTSGVFIPDRATAAIALHQRIQQSRPEAYESEVVISHICESGPWAIHISGRIDGIFRYPDRIVLEEIKTPILEKTELFSRGIGQEARACGGSYRH